MLCRGHSTVVFIGKHIGISIGVFLSPLFVEPMPIEIESWLLSWSIPIVGNRERDQRSSTSSGGLLLVP